MKTKSDVEDVVIPVLFLLVTVTVSIPVIAKLLGEDFSWYEALFPALLVTAWSFGLFPVVLVMMLRELVRSLRKVWHRQRL